MIAKSVKAGLAAAVFGCFGTAGCLVAAKPKSPPRHASLPPAALLRITFVLLQNGDAAGARQVYVYLAFNGSADGARGVGDTYNPLVLRALSNANALGNEDQARFWYAKAVQMEEPRRPVVASR
jgi:hypothetical protein